MIALLVTCFSRFCLGNAFARVMCLLQIFLEDSKLKSVETSDEEILKEALQVGDVVKKIRDAPIEEYKIINDKHTRTWEVKGAGLDRFTQMTNWE